MSKRKATSSKGFGAVKTEADLVAKLGEGNLPNGFQLKPSADLTLDALKNFLKEFATNLSAADWIVRIRSSHEKARSLLVYEVLKQFLLFGRGRRLHLEQTSVADIEESEQGLYFAFEERLTAEEVQLAGLVEFVITHGPNGRIQMVVEVKKGLSPQTYTDESTWHLYAELLAACQYNLDSTDQEEVEVYGCLTDAYTWYFYRATKNAKSWSISAAEDVILFHPTAKATNTTATAINLFFSSLIPDMTDAHGSDIDPAQQKCDAVLNRRATRYMQDALEVAELEEELENVRREREEIARERQEIAREREELAKREQRAHLRAELQKQQ